MRVKLIESSGYMHLTVGKEYEIQKADKLHHTHYAIYNDVGCVGYYERRWFEVVKEPIQIIRTLKDFDGLENNGGLKLKFIPADPNSAFDCLNIIFNDSTTELEIYLDEINILKGMGFKFEYKPLRSKEEILEEIKTNGNTYSCENDFVVSYTKKHGWSAVTLGRDIIGNCYFREDIANKYCVELNEIERNNK